MSGKSHFWAWFQFITMLLIGTVILFKLLNFIIISIPLILGVVMYYSSKPIIEFLIRHGISRKMSVNIVFVTSTILSLLLIYFIPSWFYQEILNLKNKAPLVISQIQDLLTSTENWLNTKLPPDIMRIDIESYVMSLAKKLLPLIFSNLPGMITNLIIIIAMTPVFGFFLLKDSKQFKEFFLNITPNRYYEMAAVIIDRINKQVGNYIVGRIIEAAAVGIIVLLPTAFAGVEGSVLIAFIVAVTNIIPYIGPIIGTIVGVILGFASVTTSFTPIWVILFACGAAQLIDAVILSPVIVGKSMNLHPLVVFTTFIIAARMFGILGLIVGVPIVAIYVITFQSFRQALKGFAPYEKI